MAQTNLFDPTQWLVSQFRSLKEYVESVFDPDIYDIQFSYPDITEMMKGIPLPKTLIHFEIENPENIKFGFGDNVVQEEYLLDELGNEIGDIQEWEASRHEITWDVGIWASAESGGVTSRLEAYQILCSLFVGPRAYAACLEATEGVQILSFTGGGFVIDPMNGTPVYRVVGIELRTLVFGLSSQPPVPFIEEITPEPGVDVEGEVIVETV